jgi:hypothetical protein
MKSNNSTASKKKNPKHEIGVCAGIHSAGKDNSPRATLRTNSLPQSETVTVVSNTNNGKAIELAKKQNTMNDEQLAQVPAGKKFPTVVSSGN